MTKETFADLEADEIEEYDPLDEIDEEEDELEEGEEFTGKLGEPHEAAVVKVDERPAEERIEDLFKAMAPRRKTLLGILEFCLVQHTVEDVSTRIDELQEFNSSVFTPANLCKLLEDAGAIMRIAEDGTPYNEIEVEPILIEEDGVEYYEVAEPPQVYYIDTPEGRAYYEADNPLERLKSLLAKDEKYAEVYKIIFDMTSGEGATMKEIASAIDDLPIVQKPRLYAPHFIDKLEKCDAVEWRKKWNITEVGEEGKVELAKYLSE